MVPNKESIWFFFCPPQSLSSPGDLFCVFAIDAKYCIGNCSESFLWNLLPTSQTGSIFSVMDTGDGILNGTEAVCLMFVDRFHLLERNIISRYIDAVLDTHGIHHFPEVTVIFSEFFPTVHFSWKQEALPSHAQMPRTLYASYKGQYLYPLDFYPYKMGIRYVVVKLLTSFLAYS